MPIRVNKNQVQTVGGRLILKAASKNKMGAIKTTLAGLTFDSRGEAERYLILRQMEKDGEISGLQRQVPFVLLPPMVIQGRRYRQTTYVADFTYYDNNQLVVEDFKGHKTAEYKLKRKLMKHIHNIEVTES